MAGQVYSCHTTNDQTLTVFETLYTQRSIGRNPQYSHDRQNVANTLAVDGSDETSSSQSTKGGKKELWFKFENFDVSMMATGHMDYRHKLDLILEHINFQS